MEVTNRERPPGSRPFLDSVAHLSQDISKTPGSPKCPGEQGYCLLPDEKGTGSDSLYHQGLFVRFCFVFLLEMACYEATIQRVPRYTVVFVTKWHDEIIHLGHFHPIFCIPK
jgi:hypothetical protein